MTYHYIAKHRVEFYETDLAGIVHFANFYRFMEQAEHEFFRSLGQKIHATFPDGTVYGWPRVSASCSFVSPAYYGDVIDICMTIERLTQRSVTIAYHFQRDGIKLASGEMKSAYCIFPDGKIKSAEMPKDVFDQLTAKLNQTGIDATPTS